MNAFEALRTSAILGTQQASTAFTIDDPEAAALVSTDTTESAEHAILRAAAVFGTIRRAYPPVQKIQKREQPASEEVLARCSPRAAQDLRDILSGDRLAFLREWLEVAASFKLRAPELLLPKLLERGASDRSIREAICTVLGERGRWLTEYETKWRYAIESLDPLQVFNESPDIADRRREFRRMRLQNPATARELLEAAWPRESPSDRHALLQQLGTGLSLGDEPFLERLLGEKRKDIRGLAMALLHQLPGSQSAERAILLASPFLTLKRGLLGRDLVVALPELTAELEAEGIEEQPRSRFGVRAALLSKLLGLVPIEHWLDTFALSMEKLVELARKNEHAEALLTGFADAIKSYRSEAALQSVLDLAAHNGTLIDMALAAHFADGSVHRPDRPYLEAFRTKDPRANELVALASRPWSVELSEAAISSARRSLEGASDMREHQARAQFFTLLASNVAPDTHGMLIGWPTSYVAVNTQVMVEQTLEKLAFRRAMYEHLEDQSHLSVKAKR